MRHSLAGLLPLLLAIPLLTGAGRCGGGGTVDCTTIAVPSVEITLVDESGAPIAGATVTFRPQDGSPQSCDAISEPGTYVCGFEVAGTVDIDIVAEGYQPTQLTVEVNADECHVLTEERSVTLVADDGAA